MSLLSFAGRGSSDDSADDFEETNGLADLGDKEEKEEEEDEEVVAVKAAIVDEEAADDKPEEEEEDEEAALEAGDADERKLLDRLAPRAKESETEIYLGNDDEG